MNQVLLGLSTKKDIDLEIFFSQEWLGKDNKLNPKSPLRELPLRTFPTRENSTERTWKLFRYPGMDNYLPNKIDWLYAPMETYIPVSKCPVAVTIHDIQAFENNLPWSKTWKHKWFRYKWGRWVRRTLADCRIVFTVSEFSKKRMVELLGAKPEKIVVVGNGVEQSFFDVAGKDPQTLDIPGNKPYVLVIGGLREKKGAAAVLAVAIALKQRCIEMNIVVVGESEAEYVKIAQTFSNIILLGGINTNGEREPVGDEKLPDILRAASSLLFLSPYEGFGIPALEAMAAGVPVIAANRASLPEVVDDAGFLVEPEATEEILDIIIQLENNRSLRQNYIYRGRNHASQYTWSQCVDKIANTLKHKSMI
ncbi:MAG: glycosyltransferase family 1 protein [Cyanobacteria bacterium P01_A01_bin.84]